MRGLGGTDSTLSLRSRPDGRQHLATNQATERPDEQPVRLESPPSLEVGTQNPSLGGDVGVLRERRGDCKVPYGFGRAGRTRFTETLRAGWPELPSRAPEAPHRAQDELLTWTLTQE